MTVTGQKPGGRYSPEQQQEDRSEGQLKDRCAEFGWPLDRVNRDLGEDLRVRIYDEGASTGLSFHVQVKSTADSAALKRSATLICDLEVKALLHWEVSATLVVLVVWDVKMRTGWWRPIPEIIKDLDATTKGWRNKKTAAVSLPIANGTDEAGLRLLRHAVAGHTRPLVQGDKSFALSMSLAPTEDGRRLEEHLDWLPDNPPRDAMYEALVRLSANVGRYDGYFTCTDAGAAGMSDTVFEAVLREQKVEPIAADVYHLVQFPHADREELITLWLQTDRQGVLSHETALLLHELSDILPRRLHIMVPPGFEPGARRFDPSVELLRGDVADDEKCWLGPVPYTSALRTLRDCIDIGVSPDLIEQAIEEGLDRGLFTEDQIPVTAPAKSA